MGEGRHKYMSVEGMHEKNRGLNPGFVTGIHTRAQTTEPDNSKSPFPHSQSRILGSIPERHRSFSPLVHTYMNISPSIIYEQTSVITIVYKNHTDNRRKTMALSKGMTQTLLPLVIVIVLQIKTQRQA